MRSASSAASWELICSLALFTTRRSSSARSTRGIAHVAVTATDSTITTVATSHEGSAEKALATSSTMDPAGKLSGFWAASIADTAFLRSGVATTALTGMGLE